MTAPADFALVSRSDIPSAGTRSPANCVMLTCAPVRRAAPAPGDRRPGSPSAGTDIPKGTEAYTKAR